MGEQDRIWDIYMYERHWQLIRKKKKKKGGTWGHFMREAVHIGVNVVVLLN